MRIILAATAITLIAGCAPLQHAAQTSARLSCTDHSGQPIPAPQRTADNCFAGTYAERICDMHRRNPNLPDIRHQCLATQQSVSGTASSQTVILPSGTFVVTRTGNLTSVTRSGGSR